MTKDAKAARSAAADPLYDAWRNTPVPPTPELNGLQPRLNAAGVAGSAYQKMGIEGVPGYQNWFTRDAEGNLTMNAAQSPTAQTWDYMKRGLNSKISTAKVSGDADSVRMLTGLKSDLIGALDNHPDPNVAGVWQQARQAWADPTTIMNARDMGYEAFTKGQRVDQMRQDFPGLSQPEKLAYAQGARGAVADLMDGSVRGDTNARNMFLAPANQQKLALMAGPQRAQQLTNSLNQEATLKDQSKAVIGGPRTAGWQKPAGSGRAQSEHRFCWIFEKSPPR